MTDQGAALIALGLLGAGVALVYVGKQIDDAEQLASGGLVGSLFGGRGSDQGGSIVGQLGALFGGSSGGKK